MWAVGYNCLSGCRIDGFGRFVCRIMGEVGAYHKQIVLVQIGLQGGGQPFANLRRCGADYDWHNPVAVLKLVMQKRQLYLNTVLIQMRRRVICKQFGIDLGQHLSDLRIHQLPAVRHDKVAVAIHRRPVVMGLVRRCNQEYPPVRCLVVQLIKSRSSHRTRKDIACMGTDNSPHSALLLGCSHAEKRLHFPLQHIRMGRIELTGHRRMPVYFDILSIHTQSICL